MVVHNEHTNVNAFAFQLSLTRLHATLCVKHHTPNPSARARTVGHFIDSTSTRVSVAIGEPDYKNRISNSLVLAMNP
eukprot:776899-Amphidinium_carterae.2